MGFTKKVFRTGFITMKIAYALAGSVTLQVLRKLRRSQTALEPDCGSGIHNNELPTTSNARIAAEALGVFGYSSANKVQTSESVALPLA